MSIPIPVERDLSVVQASAGAGVVVTNPSDADTSPAWADVNHRHCLETIFFALATFSVATASHAVTQPTETTLGVKQLTYQETQGSLKRMRVEAWSTHLVAPIGETWSAEAYLVTDAISGASPAFYASPVSFSKVTDRRDAGDMKVYYHGNRQRFGVGLAYSDEADYISQNGSLHYSLATEDRNQTWDFGVSYSDDTINPVTKSVPEQKKYVSDYFVGLQQVLTPVDLVQLTLFHSRGRGYLSDPYKLFDRRPDRREANAFSVRWNHHFTKFGGTSRVGVRLYQDSFGIQSTTLTAEFALPAMKGFFLTPSVRLYSQTAADFYAPPDLRDTNRPNFPDGFRPGLGRISFDQRVSAFGAGTIGVRVERAITNAIRADLKIERYKQASAWSVLESVPVPLPDFNAVSVQFGLTYKFQ